ncbi:glyoxylase-like metal-dependent hydrolase (beta-lactamase superfamily II) [Nocardiopsis mwathae]|uniref:Glyoxylase-like metal-dependent hydrolase (Beta-lactamase superfamily II) n=1 Tax=Nocardiopsis mwathae TaxID=1472723 RepID=A0A7W9YEE1_9ACTN|nr:MBL fold metallo-hydrolase [Nocardiopsis mwathae]MBB6170370.1 glyoxylase-like metal-dependent hydrolase (beta-lactamase superfamily II) [Nocardiopsis mwathae]
MRETPPVEDLGSGIWSIPVPIPDNPLGYTLIYALESPSGPVLVDAGWEHEESWRALCSGLEHMGSSIADVRGVVITHFHPDHSGLAGRVRAASGAWIAMHQADIDLLGRIDDLRGGGQRELEVSQLRLAGASAEEVDLWAQLDPRMEPPQPPDRPLADGELVDLPGRRLRVVWTPGHSPGHICLYLEDDGRLFTGDHLLPGITPHIGLFPFDDEHDPLSTFLESLGGLSDIGATQALPAHEHRFTAIGPRAAEIIAHHEEKLDLLAEALGSTPSTLWELAAALPWRRPWSDMHALARRMAASETAAHLRTLERRRRAIRTTGSEGVLHWTAPSTAPRSTAEATPAANR